MQKHMIGSGIAAVVLVAAVAFAAMNPAVLEQIKGAVTGASSGGLQANAVNMFLKLDGIDGEAVDEKHRNQIAVSSWSWGESNSATAAGGGSAGAGKVSMQDFHFTKGLDKSSPKLMLAGATGEHIKLATFTISTSGNPPLEFLMVRMTDVLVTSYQVSGGTTEQVSLSFAKIEIEYKPIGPDGKLGSPVKAGYDLKANKKA